MSRVTLKNVKYAAFASEETACFEATVYIDGVKKGTVSNDGHGGCDDYSDHALQQELEAIAKTLPKYEFYGEQHEHNAETMIGEIFAAWQMERDLKRDLGKKLMYTKADGFIYETKIPKAASYEAATAFLTKMNAVQCLNRMPFEQAFEIYKANAAKQKVAA